MDELKSNVKPKLGMIMFLYMLGIFMGAIDTGIVTPARTVIQANLGVEDKLGIWMITIFTLAYAASIPISGKIADRIGRKYVYIVCITLFGLGSLICGLSSNFASFPMLLVGRVIQAIGGGGIMPIANAEFGTTFPEEKRGMALGLLGGVYGLANILGSSLGSAILDIFGIENWQFLFYINLPISLVIIIFGILFLPVNKTTEKPGKIDIWGTVVIVAMILALIYGLKNIDFFNFTSTLKSVKVYPFLIGFALLLPIFILIEKRAQDPILNLKYFTSPKILITLVVSFFVGVCMMGMIFVPQFSENSLSIATGKGGYFVTILGLFTAIGAPMSGKLVDKYGAGKILSGGFIVSLIGSLFLAFVATNINNLTTVLVSLALIGTGLGFVMGSPLNYMMLGNTRKEQANSALATLSLVRSIGTVIAPSIMIGFIAQAGIVAQDQLMGLLPQPTAPELTQAVELNKTFEEMKKDPRMAEMLKDVNIPDLNNTSNMNFDMKSGEGLPANLVKSMQSADVTNIVDKAKEIAVYMFDKNTPAVIEKIQSGIQQGIDGMNQGITGIDTALSQMGAGTGKSVVAQGSDTKTSRANEKDQGSAGQSHGGMGSPQGMQGQLGQPGQSGQQNMAAAVAGMKAQRVKMADTVSKMEELKNSIPAAFEQSKKDYLNKIDTLKPQIEESFQDSLSEGFKQMYLTVSVFCVLSILLLLMYREPVKTELKN